jgi:hypothetical protein
VYGYCCVGYVWTVLDWTGTLGALGWSLGDGSAAAAAAAARLERFRMDRDIDNQRACHLVDAWIMSITSQATRSNCERHGALHTCS